MRSTNIGSFNNRHYHLPDSYNANVSTISVSVSSVNADTVVYSITSSYTSEPTVEYDFTGLTGNFTDGNTGSVTLNSGGSATITKTLDQTSTYSDAEFAINLYGNDNYLLTSGANVELLGNVTGIDFDFYGSSNVTTISAPAGYKIYEITGNVNFKRTSTGTDPYQSITADNIQINALGGGAGASGMTPGKGGLLSDDTLRFNDFSTSSNSTIQVGKGGTVGQGGSTFVYPTSGVNVTGNPGTLESVILATQTQNYTTLYAQKGGTGSAVVYYNRGVYTGVTDGPTAGSVGTITGAPNLTASGGNGGAGQTGPITGTRFGGGGGGGARWTQTTPDGFTYTAVAGGNGSGTVGQGGRGGTGQNATPSGAQPGQDGAVWIKFPNTGTNYPVLLSI